MIGLLFFVLLFFLSIGWNFVQRKAYLDERKRRMELEVYSRDLAMKLELLGGDK